MQDRQFLNRLSFRSKIIWGITAVIMVFGLLSAFFVSRIATEVMLGEIKKRGLGLGVSLAARTADPMLALDFLRLKNMVDEVKESSDDILYTFVQDRQGQVLSHTFKGGFPVQLKAANQVPAGAPQHIQLLAFDEDDRDERVYDFAIPVTISHERLGTVRLGLSQIKAQAAVQGLLFIIFSVSLGAGLVAVVLGTFFARTVTRRLDILRKSAEEIVKGNLNVQTGPKLRQNCWELRECRESQCPAYGDHRRRCWYLAGTRCPECTPGGFEQKITACQNCPVYRETRGDEIQSLAEAFDFMALSLDTYIEDLKTAQRNITRQQQILKTMLDVSPDLVSLQDGSLRYQAANPAFAQFFSLTPEQIAGRSDHDLFPPPVADLIRSEDEMILKTGVPLSKQLLVTKNRHNYWFHMVKVPVYDEDKVAGLLFTARDITELKQYQEKLIQSLKMEELGKLAGGVAHEINTPLCIILGYAQMLLEDLPQDTESHEFLKIIEKQAQICRRIVSDLLSFSRVVESRLEEMDLNQAIEEVLNLVSHIFKQNWVEVETSLDPAIPPIRGDQEKLKQVWLNLLNNAFESIGHNGTIRVRTRLCPQGNRVLVTVADTGGGIRDEDLEKIFEPFFSTKGPGIGTGLGLSVSFGIIQEHHGSISAVSPVPSAWWGAAAASKNPPGPGALFLVELPLNWENPLEDTCRELLPGRLPDEETTL